MNPKAILLAVALLMTLSGAAGADRCTTCLPTYSSTELAPLNPCRGTGSNPGVQCSGPITKFVKYFVNWPDGSSSIPSVLPANGRSDCGSTCNPGVVIGAPYKYKECWPPFYTPQISPGSFVATAYDVTTVNYWDLCDRIPLPYVYQIGCTSPIPPLSILQLTRSCSCSICRPTPEDRAICVAAGKVWDSTVCGCRNYYTPIVVDLGDGFRLTDVRGGVQFDVNDDGRLEQTSWSAAGAHTGFLVLDRNGNGFVDNSTELFGDLTPQQVSGLPNGFLALAEYDRSENGGNGDGAIDKGDSVYGDLRLWVDRNHDGISQPDELFTLDAAGIGRIDLVYEEVGRVDRYGNRFRFRARVQGLDGEQAGRWAYDVFLQAAS